MVERLEAFERMLADVLERERSEKEQLDELRAQGKEKTATFRQLMGNRLVYVRMLEIFREHGLLGE